MGIVYQSGMGFAPGDVEYAMRQNVEYSCTQTLILFTQKQSNRQRSEETKNLSPQLK